MRKLRLLVLALWIILFAGCGGETAPSGSSQPIGSSQPASASQPTGWLTTSSTAAAFIQWTEDSTGHLTGQYTGAGITSPGTLDHFSDAFTGLENGSSISLTFSALGFSDTLNGTIQGNTLTLAASDQNGTLETGVFHPASVDDYNNAVSALQQQVNQQQAAQATASAQANLNQAVANASSTLSSDLGSLNDDVSTLQQDTSFNSDMQSYSNDWSTMQHDYQQEQADYKQGCGDNGVNANQVAADANQVSADENQLSADDNGFAATLNSVNSDISTVQRDIQSVQTDWQNLQAAVEADNTPNPVAPQFSANDVTNAIDTAQSQLASSENIIKQAQAQAKQYDQEAASLNQTAQKLANGMNC
jgi:hypothetical protein